MNRVLIVGVLLLLGSAVMPNVDAQGICEVYEPIAEGCNAFGNRPIYTNAQFGLTQQALVAIMNTPSNPSVSNNTALSVVQTMPWDCATQYLQTVCPTFLRTCVDSGSPLGNIPLNPCRSSCEATNSACSEWYQSVAGPGAVGPLDCTASDPLNPNPSVPTPLYPEDGGAFPCTLIPEDTIGEISYPCPEPLHFRAGNHPPNVPCTFECIQQPKLVTTDDDWDTGFIVLSVFSWISLVGCLYVALSYCIFEVMREFPRRIVIFISIAICWEMIAMVGNSFQSKEDFYCENRWELSHSGWCRAAGFFFFSGALMANCWWVCQAFVLFWNVALLQRPQVLARFEWLMHVVSWGVPLVLTFVMLGIDHLGARTGQPYCFTYDSSTGLEWGMFFGIVFASAIIVFVMVLLVCIRIAKESTLEQSKWERSRYQIQLGLFALAFLVSLTMVCAFRLWVNDHEDDIRDSTTAYYRCLLAGGVESQCEDLLIKSDRGLWWASLIFVGLQGLWPFLVFGMLNRQVWALCSDGIENTRSGSGSFFDAGRSGGRGPGSGSSARSALD